MISWAGLNVAGLVFHSLTHAVGSSILWHWVCALAMGKLNPTSAGPRTRTPGTPCTPSTIDWFLKHKTINHMNTDKCRMTTCVLISTSHPCLLTSDTVTDHFIRNTCLPAHSCYKADKVSRLHSRFHRSLRLLQAQIY